MEFRIGFIVNVQFEEAVKDKNFTNIHQERSELNH